MQKNIITNKITPCCGLPFSVMYWWVSNLTLNTESDRQYIISKLSQNGTLRVDAWKVLINSGTLEADASLTKAEFLAWFDCERQPSCEQLKLIIEGYKVGNWTPETELPLNVALIDGFFNGQNFDGNVYTKEQTDALLTSSFGGDLTIAENPQPTSSKWFFAKESGTYANAGNLTVDLNNKAVILSYDGTAWSKIEIPFNVGKDFFIAGNVKVTPIANGVHLSFSSGTIFFQKRSEHFFRLQTLEIDVENGSFISAPNTGFNTYADLVVTNYSGVGNLDNAIGMVWDNQLFSDVPQFKSEGFYFTDAGKDLALIEGSKIILYTKERTFFRKGTNEFFKIQGGAFNIPEGHYIYIDTWKKAEGSIIPLQTKVYNQINGQEEILGINFGNIIYSEYDWLKNPLHSEYSTELNPNNYLSKDLLRDQLRTFWEAEKIATEAKPIEITVIGDSLSNWQGDILKTDRTVEPQGLYGKTWVRSLFSKLNGYKADIFDFSGTNENQWGNMRFLRADNATKVVTNGEFLPHGTRTSDNVRVHWSQAEYVNNSSTALGGYRVADGETKTTSIGEIKLHNHVYFFADAGKWINFNIEAIAKGFSIVFWGDTPTRDFRKLPTDAPLYLTNSIQVFVDGVLVDTFNPTDFRGQSRKDYTLTPNGSARDIKVYNAGSGTMNLWGIEYWFGKCFRVKNFACAGNGESTFYQNPDYFVNKPTDLYIWQATVHNNPIQGGDTRTAIDEHKQTGVVLKATGKAILPLNTHTVVEGLGGNTNFIDGTGHFQHLDVFAANRAFYELELFYADIFSAFKPFGEEQKWENFYSRLFVDGGHLSAKGGDIYSQLINYVLSFE